MDRSLRRRAGSAVLIAAALAGWCPAVVLAQNTQVTLTGNAHRFIGGVTDLDRERFFAHQGTLTPGGSYTDLLLSEDGLNSAPSRVATEFDQFIAQGLPEDPARPGHFEPNALRDKILNSYNPFINSMSSSSRWRQINQADNPLLINSGRNASFFPEFLRTVPAGQPNAGQVHPGMVMNADGYADFLKSYLTHAQFPSNLSPDRFYIEVMNEPNADYNGIFGVQEMIDLHLDVITQVKQAFPNQQMGGPSFCCADYVDNDFGRWFSELKPFIDQAGGTVDFISLHPYDRYTVKPNGTYQRDFAKGAGHMAAVMDMVEAYSSETLGEIKPFAFTEYGSWNRTEMTDGSYGSYTREQQQWDLTRDVREKLFVFLDRPDRILSLSPFFSARHWQNATPTNPDGDNVFFEQDAQGAWQETVVAEMARMFAPVKGHYVGIDTDNPDLQVQAFRDGDKLYLLLNNLRASDQTVDIDAITGAFGNVVGATLDRIQFQGGVSSFTDDADVSSSWQQLSLTGEEGAVLTLTLDGRQLYDIAHDTRTFYGDVITSPIDNPGNRSDPTFIDADLTDATSAVLRIGYARNGNSGEEFEVFINNGRITVPAGDLALDDGDFTVVAREIEVPLSMLVDGANRIQVDFLSDGGRMAAAALEVTRTLGDYNGNVLFDAADVDALFANRGSVDPGGRYDLVGEDGVLDDADIDYWLNTLRGTVRGDANLDGIVDQGDLDAVLSNWGQTAGIGWADGDYNGSGQIEQGDLDAVLSAWGTQAAPDFALNPGLVPEPASGLALLALAGVSLRSPRRQARL